MNTDVITPPAAVTVIGLGNMGVPMAACLLKAGFQVMGFDLSEAARAKFQAAGGRVAATASDAVKMADVVITLLPDGKIVRAVLEPLKKGFKPGAVIVDMSSSDPIGTQELGNSLIAAGLKFIDAPISGGVKRATDGTLSIMVGGDRATIDRLDALLSAMGKAIFRTGNSAPVMR
jgi:3-hydroxyisobutyrate dehydrogenase